MITLEELPRRACEMHRDEDIMNNMEGVADAALALLDSLPPRPQWKLPHPNPSPEGEGLE
jgi:hypothetical protein